MTAPVLPKALADRYRVERELGRGGMGAVYLATDRRLERQVALKVLPPEFAGDTALRDRFLRETRTAASFSHPNIVPVYAVEDEGEALAFVMGFVEGESLTARVARSGPLDTRATVRLLQDVAYALAYAHGRGVVHRDIKPDNIMIERATGRALVMDFGIARAITPRSDTPGLTRVGEIVGTPEYMSPEQASGDNLDGRSDLYSLGLVALFAITGRAPVAGDSLQQVIIRQLTEPLPPAASLRSDLPPALCDAIDRCVAKEPAARFASAEGLVEAIDAAQLAAPEVPLQVRLFASDAGTLGLIVLFGTLSAGLLLRVLSRVPGDAAGWVPFVLFIAVIVTRVLQTRNEARRLADAGFTIDHVMDGFRTVLDERAAVRSAAAADATTRGRRARAVRRSILQIVLAAVMAVFGFLQRVRVNADTFQIGVFGTAFLFSGIALAGASLVLLLRSPFRATPGERLFRSVWLGPFGRIFIGSAMRPGPTTAWPDGKLARATLSPVRPVPSPPRIATPAPAGAAVGTPELSAAPDTIAQLARIEERLAAIERAVTPKRGE